MAEGRDAVSAAPDIMVSMQHRMTKDNETGDAYGIYLPGLL